MLLMHLPDVLLNGELGITEVPNYRAFYPTSTELKIDAELIPKLRLSSDQIDDTQNLYVYVSHLGYI